MRTRVRADQRVGLLLGGVLLATFVALGSSVALPSADPDLEGESQDLSRLEARGMDVYRAEGCWYCHTMYVRETTVDGELGEPLDAGAYAGSSPSMLGLERIGSDLTHYGARSGRAAEVLGFLRDPSDGYQHQFSYLSDDDLEALAAYLASLR